MRLAKSFLKYFIFFFLGIIASAIVSTTVVAYYAIDNLSYQTPAEVKKNTDTELDTKKAEFPWINPNVQEVFSIGTQYLHELTAYDELESKVLASRPKKICAVVCNPSELDTLRAREERTNYYHGTEPRKKILAACEAHFPNGLE